MATQTVTDEVRAHNARYRRVPEWQKAANLCDIDLRDAVTDLLEAEFRMGRLGSHAVRYLETLVQELFVRNLDWCLSWSTVKRFGKE